MQHTCSSQWVFATKVNFGWGCAAGTLNAYPKPDQVQVHLQPYNVYQTKDQKSLPLYPRLAIFQKLGHWHIPAKKKIFYMSCTHCTTTTKVCFSMDNVFQSNCRSHAKIRTNPSKIKSKAPVSQLVNADDTSVIDTTLP